MSHVQIHLSWILFPSKSLQSCQKARSKSSNHSTSPFGHCCSVQILPVIPALRSTDSPQWQCLHSGVHMAGLCMEAAASINHQAPGSHQPSGPTAVQTDYQGSFYIISPAPWTLAHPPPFDDQHSLAGHRWNVLANISKDYHKPHKLFDLSGWGESEEEHQEDPGLYRVRSVLEHVIELIEINIHDRTRARHLAWRLMPTSVSAELWPVAARAACWGMAGVAWLSPIYRATHHKHQPPPRHCHSHQLLHKDIHKIRAWAWSTALSPPSRQPVGPC